MSKRTLALVCAMLHTSLWGGELGEYVAAIVRELRESPQNAKEKAERAESPGRLR